MERVELSRSYDQLFLKQPRIPFRHIATNPLGRIRTLITTFEASRDIQFHYERSLVLLGLSARFERAVPDLGNRCLFQLGDERSLLRHPWRPRHFLHPVGQIWWARSDLHRGFQFVGLMSSLLDHAPVLEVWSGNRDLNSDDRVPSAADYQIIPFPDGGSDECCPRTSAVTEPCAGCYTTEPYVPHTSNPRGGTRTHDLAPVRS